MTRRERVRVRLDGLLTEGRLEIVRTVVFGQLVGSAGDLDLLGKMRDPRRAVKEVAALARLSYWLEMDEMYVPDRIAREVMSRLATEIDGMNERAETTGGDPVAEHDAMWAFVNLLSDWPADAEVEDPPSVKRALGGTQTGRREMRDGRGSWLWLGDIGDERLAILREGANEWLVTKADDLPRAIADTPRSRREFEEVAALGRLASGLRRGAIAVPDPMVRELVARETSEAVDLERVKEEYDRLLAEHESWSALLTHIDSPPPESVAGDEEEDLDAEPESRDLDQPVAASSAPGLSRRIESVGRLSDDQIRRARGAVALALADRAGDLRLLHKRPDPEQEIGEVAALARLAFELDRGELQVPDPIAAELISRMAADVDEMEEFDELRESHEEAVAEHEALVALAAFLSGDPPAGSLEPSCEGSGGGDR